MSGFGSSSRLLFSFVLFCLFASVSSVFGHVTFSPKEAVQGTYQYFNINVPHGCGDAGTIKVVVVFPTYITSITMERTYYYDISKSYAPHHSDGLVHWQAEWNSNNNPPLPHDQLQRFGVQIKVPALTSLPADKKIIFPIYQFCEEGATANWTSAVTILESATAGAGGGSTTTPPPSSSSTTTTTTTAAAHNHDHSSTADAHGSEWTSSDKLSVASLVICSMMFLITLVLLNKSSFSCINIDNNYNNSNNNNNTMKRMATSTSNSGASKEVAVELEEKTNANNAISTQV